MTRARGFLEGTRWEEEGGGDLSDGWLDERVGRVLNPLE
jgi:hypothetical protein